MPEFILIPGLGTSGVVSAGVYEEWLKKWLTDTLEDCEKGVVSSSMCVAGLATEEVLFGRAKTDWIGLMSQHLECSKEPIAYSRKFGERLYKYEQWLQSEIHAIYARWWVESKIGRMTPGYDRLLMKYVQPTGWIYNPNVSDTKWSYRMRYELFLSLAMACQIVSRGSMPSQMVKRITSAASSLPCTGYVGAEYFRYRALEMLNQTSQMVVGVKELLEKCRVPPGFSDFSILDKRDDYMGVAKRTSRDVAVFSPISTAQAIYLASHCGLPRKAVDQYKADVRGFLKSHPFEIPAFKMRDLEPDFGDSVTVYEILAAALLLV